MARTTTGENRTLNPRPLWVTKLHFGDRARVLQMAADQFKPAIPPEVIRYKRSADLRESGQTLDHAIRVFPEFETLR